MKTSESFISRRPRLAAFVAGLVFSALMTLAFEPFVVWPLVFVAILPLVIVALHPAVGGARPGRTALFAWFGMLPFWGFVGQWVVNISNLGYIPLVWYTAATTAIGVWLMAAAGRLAPKVPGVVIVPVMWTGAEVLRGNVIWDGYPWYQIGHPLIESPVLSSPARLLGAYLVSFLVAMLCGAAGDVIAKRPRRWVGVGAAVLAWGVSIGAASAFKPGVSPTVVRVGVLQTNLPQSVKGEWDLQHRYDDHQRWLEQTLKLAEQKPDVIAWPETMYAGFVLDTDAWKAIVDAKGKFPGLEQNLGVFRSDLLAVSRKIQRPMLIGASGYRGLRVAEEGEDKHAEFRPEKRFNSVMLVNGGVVEAGRYDKMQLTPFGEVMPYISAWPWLERQFLTIGVGASGMNFDLSAGTEPYVFDVKTREGKDVRIVTPICFEATIPSVCRKLVYGAGGRRADLIVQATNDGWFGTFDAGRLHHALCARWRAVELGTPVVRVANTGVSMVVGADGLVKHVVKDASGKAGNAEASEVVEVALSTGATPYGSIGDVFGLVMLGAAGVVAVGTAARKGGPGSSKAEEQQSSK